VCVCPQLSATAIFLAGVIIALLDFPDNNIPSAMDTLKAHKAVGITIIALVGVQVCVAHALSAGRFAY
jgi:cytochrome b561